MVYISSPVCDHAGTLLHGSHFTCPLLLLSHAHASAVTLRACISPRTAGCLPSFHTDIGHLFYLFAPFCVFTHLFGHPFCVPLGRLPRCRPVLSFSHFTYGYRYVAGLGSRSTFGYGRLHFHVFTAFYFSSGSNHSLAFAFLAFTSAFHCRFLRSTSHSTFDSPTPRYHFPAFWAATHMVVYAHGPPRHATCVTFRTPSDTRSSSLPHCAFVALVAFHAAIFFTLPRLRFCCCAFSLRAVHASGSTVGWACRHRCRSVLPFFVHGCIQLRTYLFAGPPHRGPLA